MENDTISSTMAKLMSNVVKMNDQCYHIFNEHGGYNYNDDMLYQLQGLRQSIGECLNEEDWDNMVKEASTTLKWFKHIEKIRKLEESIPNSLYC
tara:strand:+ start:104 stop:385 length:282 start_codon:yes stop_codon:yes gene_type:complete